jgi:hypothetical protein
LTSRSLTHPLRPLGDERCVAARGRGPRATFFFADVDCVNPPPFVLQPMERSVAARGDEGREVGAGTTRCHHSESRPLPPLSPGDRVSGPRNLAHRLHFDHATARSAAICTRRAAGTAVPQCLAAGPAYRSLWDERHEPNGRILEKGCTRTTERGVSCPSGGPCRRL